MVGVCKCRLGHIFLRDYDEIITTEFVLNLEKYHPRVQGLSILVTEEAILAVSGLPQEGKKWFSWKAPMT